MSEAFVIKRSDRRQREASFEKLREAVIGFAQEASGTRWTDYNLHDPGVTILEQLVYGLTDLAHRVDFDVADHLTDPSGEIDFARLALHPPQRAFPCRATTADDFRRVLLDRVKGLDDARLTPGGAANPGVHRLTLRLASPAVGPRDRLIAKARAAFRSQRNLGEDLEPRIELIEDDPCELHAEIELAGPRDAVEVVAEVYERCATLIAGRPQFRALSDVRRDGGSLEQYFTGPKTKSGLLVDDAAQSGEELLFVGELSAQVRAIDGVDDLRWLALQRDGERPQTGWLTWKGPHRRLSLRVPGEGKEGKEGKVRVWRRGDEVPLHWPEVWTHFAVRQAAARARRTRKPEEAESNAKALLPRGKYRDLQRYQSVQEHFPAIYGIGRFGVPPEVVARWRATGQGWQTRMAERLAKSSAQPEARARARQLSAYLALLEQMIANGAAQVAHVRDLFSDEIAGRSYWQQLLGSEIVPGLDDLYKDKEKVVKAVFAPFDPHIERKGRALDHLLALHGQTYAQNSQRQFLGHLSPEEADAWLLENKAAYLREIVDLTRDRAGGFNDGKPSWNVPGNCSGLQRRVALLLGFAPTWSRPLTEALRREGLGLVARFPCDAPSNGAPEPVSDEQWRASEPAGCRTELDLYPQTPLPPPGEPAGCGGDSHLRDEMRGHAHAIHWLRGGELPPGLWRAGVRANGYRTWNTPDDRHRLLLGPDEDGQWWNLGDFDDTRSAHCVADSLRRFLLDLTTESEGLHVVEHVLLRPVDSGAGFQYGLRVSVVLPAWTVRTRQPSFRRFTEETVAINCPAHLIAKCRWLEYDAMREFEQAYESWLEARRAWHRRLAAGDVPDGLAKELDKKAGRVIDFLFDQAMPDDVAFSHD